MRNYTKTLIYFWVAFFLCQSWSCKKDTFNTANSERPAPSIAFSSQDDTLEAYEGTTVSATIYFEAQAGISSVQITRDGDLEQTIEGVSGQVRIEHRIQYPVPEGSVVGSRIAYDFVLEDRLGRQTQQSLTIAIIDPPPVPEFEFEDITIGGNDYKLINLDINRDVTLSSDHDYLLRGKISVTQGAVLTIEEGTSIYAEAGASLLVATGTKIIAEGTSSNPIEFTSLNAKSGAGSSGDWIGIFIHGLAPVATTNSTVVGSFGEYGGENASDNSGTLRYVKISYAGALGVTGGGQELNAALNLNGVGAGTQIEHVYVGESGLSRTGVLAAGGSVRMRYLFIENPNGRAFVWKDGYSGLLQFLVAVYTSNPNNAFTAIDGFGDTSIPVLSNISIQGGGQSNTRGVRFRDPSKGRIYNCWINGTGNPGLRTDATTDVVFANGRVWGNTANYHSSASSYNSAAAPYFNSSDAVTVTDGYKGIASGNAMDPTTLDAWFSATAYIGAVDPTNDWTGWWN